MLQLGARALQLISCCLLLCVVLAAASPSPDTKQPHLQQAPLQQQQQKQQQKQAQQHRKDAVARGAQPAAGGQQQPAREQRGSSKPAAAQPSTGHPHAAQQPAAGGQQQARRPPATPPTQAGQAPAQQLGRAQHQARTKGAAPGAQAPAARPQQPARAQHGSSKAAAQPSTGHPQPAAGGVAPQQQQQQAGSYYRDGQHLDYYDGYLIGYDSPSYSSHSSYGSGYESYGSGYEGYGSGYEGYGSGYDGGSYYSSPGSGYGGYASGYGGHGGHKGRGGAGNFLGFVAGHSFKAPLHCATCCPNTTTTRENTEDILIPEIPVTVTAACPQPLPETDPLYTYKCKKDNVTSLQIGGTCKLNCSNPKDYAVVTLTNTTYQTGCSDDGPQTSCSASATTIVVVNPANGAVAYQRYNGSCTITAVARCCKQTCPVLPPPPEHKEPPHHSYYDPPSDRHGHDGQQQHQEQRHHTPKVAAAAAAASVAVAAAARPQGAGGATQPALFGQDAAAVSRLGLMPTHQGPGERASEDRHAGSYYEGYYEDASYYNPSSSYDSYSQSSYDYYGSPSYDYGYYDSQYYYGSQQHGDYAPSYGSPTGATGATGPQQEHHHHHGPGFLKQVSRHLLYADHCVLCVPGTQDEVESLPTPILPAVPLLPATASCPQPPDNNATCKHDPTPSYQWGGTCKVTCINPLDYKFITPVDEKYQTGCNADGVETSCTYVATLEIITTPGYVTVPTYTGSCFVTAVAYCCKQACKPSWHRHHPHHPAPYSYGAHQQHGGYEYAPPDEQRHASWIGRR